MTANTSSKTTSWEDYPYLVVRRAPLYGRTPIIIASNEHKERNPHAITVFWNQKHPARDGSGNITPPCRALLIELTKHEVRRTGLRTCVVLGPADCEYVELDGSVVHYTEPPSYVINLPNGQSLRLDVYMVDEKIIDVKTT